jgi:hypothetical protein
LDVGSRGLGRKWLVIERRHAGRYAGYRWLQKSESRSMGVIVDDWAGFYFGKAGFNVESGRNYNPYTTI